MRGGDLFPGVYLHGWCWCSWEHRGHERLKWPQEGTGRDFIRSDAAAAAELATVRRDSDAGIRFGEVEQAGGEGYGRWTKCLNLYDAFSTLTKTFTNYFSNRNFDHFTEICDDDSRILIWGRDSSMWVSRHATVDTQLWLAWMSNDE